MKKRVLSLFMALMLCLTLLPTAALADELGSVDGASTVETADSGSTPAAGETGGETEAEPDAEANADAEAEAKAKAEAEAEEKAEAKAKADAEAAAAVQAQIDALPAVGALRGMNDGALDAAYMAIQEAYDAYDALTAEQQAQITGAECFEALFGWFNGQIAPLADEVKINPDGADANGDIIKDTSFDRTGPVLTENDTTLSGKYYIVQGNITISGDLTVDGSKEGGLVLCQDATLTVEGALIHSGGNGFYIYGQSNGGAAAGELIINNSSGGGAAIQSTSASAPRLGISSGKVTINGGSSKKLVDNVELYSTKPIHEGILDGEAKLPSEWGNSSISGGNLVLEYCGHDHAAYTPSGDTQHIKSCTQCGFNTGSSPKIADCGSDGYERTVSAGVEGHRKECPCGNLFGDVIEHMIETVPTYSKQNHITGCRECDYTEGAPQDHDWDRTTGECTGCGFKPIALDKWECSYDSLQEAMNEASKIPDGPLVTLCSEASGKAIDDGFVFNYPDKTITLNMNGYTLENEGAPVITVEAGTLKITGAATISQTATSQELVAPAIEVTGGELIFEDTLNVTGSAQNLSAAPAILVKGGTVKFEKDVTATAVENAGSSTLLNPAIAPAVKVTGGKLIFNGKLTATGGLGGVPKNTRPCEPAVYAEGGELEFNGDLDLNGGLTITGSAELTKGLTQGAFKVDYGSQTVNGKQLSVEGSSVYAKVSALLAENHVCVKTESLVEGKDKEYVNTGANICSFDVTIEEHTHKWTPAGSSHDCVCGASDGHKEWENGKCGVCGYACLHESVNNDGTCFTCGEKMTVEIVAKDGTTTYGTDFKAALDNAANGTKITLLANAAVGTVALEGKTVTLDLNGKTVENSSRGSTPIQVGSSNSPASLVITGRGSFISVDQVLVVENGTLDLSQWTGDDSYIRNVTISGENSRFISPNGAGKINTLAFTKGAGTASLNGGRYDEIAYVSDNTIKLGDLLAEGYAFRQNGTFLEYASKLESNDTVKKVEVVKCPHPDAKDGKCLYCGQTGILARVGDTTYDDVSKAVTDWLANGGTLKLYADYTAATEKATWTIVSGEHSIDLNGHRMSVKGDGAFKPTNNMHLTVTDGTERGQIENILLDGSQRGSFTLESGYVGNLEMTGGAVVALKGGSVDELDVQNCSANTNLSIQGGSLGKLNIKDWADGMYVSATGGSLGAYNLPSGKILADVLDHQYYAEGTSLDRQVDTAQSGEKFVIKQAPYDFGSNPKAADVPINGSIPFRVDSPSENVGVYEVKWYRSTNSGAEHMTENRVAGVKVNDTLEVFCVITGVDSPGGAMQWQVAVKGYTIKVVPAKLNGATVTLDHDSFVFDNTSHQPKVDSVTLDNKALTNDDYTVSVNKETNAGTYELIVTGTKNYTGTVRVPWTIQPHTIGAPVSGSTLTVTKTYDGTGALPAAGLTESSVTFKSEAKIDSISEVTLKQGEDFTISGHYDAADAGDNLGADITITLTEGGNYTFKDAKTGEDSPTATLRGIGTITPATVSTEAKPYDLYVVNNLEREYLIDPAKLLPTLDKGREFGTIGYAWSHDSALDTYYGSDFANGVGTTIKNDKILLRLAVPATVDKTTEAKIGNVTYTAKTQNYGNITLTVNVNATNKIVPTGEPTLSTKTLTYGQALSAIKLSGTMKDDGKTVPGTFAWVDGTVKPNAGSYEAAWKFTPTDGDTYIEADGTVTITVNKAKPTGEPVYTKITAAKKTLADAQLKRSTSWPEGTIQWVDKDGNPLADTTEVKANTEYQWKFIPADTANYNEAAGTLTLWARSSGGSNGGGGAAIGGTTAKADTVTNPDGSTTKTETKADGTVVETTTAKDGSTTVTETKKDGSSVTESKNANGSTGTVKTDKNGQTEASAKISDKAVSDAKNSGDAVKVPAEVKAGTNSNSAPTVKVELPAGSGETKIEIPVSNVNTGTVAVIVHPDGTEEIMKDSIPTENGVQLTVSGDATVKVMDNSKNFTDTAGHWSEKNIDFVSARGLLNGTSADRFSPNAPTTRAQLWTVLARQADADLTGGANWFEKAQAWSVTNGISDGANPSGAISRAQMVAMLWRAAGSPEPKAAAGRFSDVTASSYYADAVAWAVENGITTGTKDGRFDPYASCTRAQIAAFLYRLYVKA